MAGLDVKRKSVVGFRPVCPGPLTVCGGQGIFLFAFGFTIALVMCVVPAIIYKQWATLGALGCFVVAPMCYAFCAKASSGGDVFAGSAEGGPEHIGQFFAAALAMVGLGIPLILTHIDKLKLWPPAILTDIGGIALFVIVGIADYLASKGDGDQYYRV